MSERGADVSTSSTTGGSRIAGLDLIRGIAIGLVVLRHAFPTPFTGAGVVGVVMFFALSGYLITGLLLDETERTGRVSFGRFYRRRARRLVPALVVLVLGFAVVTLTLDPLGDRHELGRTVLFALTWTGDLPFGHASAATFHLWTLAGEEQFYLVWPAVLAWAVLHRRVDAALVAVAIGCALACLVTVVRFHAHPDLAYALPTSWAICFVVGAATRIHQHRLAAPAWAVPVALSGLLVLSVIPLRGHVLTYLAGGPAIAALTGVLLLAWRTLTDVSAPALRALVWLGTVSYAAYLWNYPLTLWLRPGLGYAAGPVAAALTLVAAALSWRFVEAPLQQRPREPVTA